MFVVFERAENDVGHGIIMTGPWLPRRDSAWGDGPRHLGRWPGGSDGNTSCPCGRLLTGPVAGGASGESKGQNHVERP
jgi:hypothetical protein